MKTDNNSIVAFDITVSEIELRLEQIRASLGYPGELTNHLVDELIEEYISKTGEFLELKGGYRIISADEFELGPDFFLINGTVFNCGRIITGQLKKSDSIAVFAVSAGKKLDALIKKLNDIGDTVAAFVLNTIGSEAAEQGAIWIENHIGEFVKKQNLNYTNRLSPGYCEWSVSEQHKLFSFLPENFLGISLTESALMTPIKSISGVIGIGADIVRKNYICSICNMENCYRRKNG